MESKFEPVKENDFDVTFISNELTPEEEDILRLAVQSVKVEITSLHITFNYYTDQSVYKLLKRIYGKSVGIAVVVSPSSPNREVLAKSEFYKIMNLSISLDYSKADIIKIECDFRQNPSLKEVLSI